LRSQNQVDRIECRRSTRIKNWNGVAGNGGDSNGGDGSIAGAACRRGGIKFSKKKLRKRKEELTNQECWEVVAEPARIAAARASKVISNLSQGLSNLLDLQTTSWIESMKSIVAGGLWLDENGAFITNSLQSLVVRCIELVTGLQFVTMINMLQLAVKTDRYINLSAFSAFLTVTKILQHHVCKQHQVSN
jgi:hypothetical protein